MKYNFDEVIDRRGTHSVKWEAGELLKDFGLTDRFDEDTISLFVADMDFPVPEPVLAALHARVDRKMFGYSTYDTSPDYFQAHSWHAASRQVFGFPGPHLLPGAVKQPLVVALEHLVFCLGRQ